MEAYLEDGFTNFSASNYMLRRQEAGLLMEMGLRRQKSKVVLLEALAMTVPMSWRESAETYVQSEWMNRFPVSRFHNIWRHGLDPLDVQPRMWKGYIIRKGVKKSPKKEIKNYMHPDSGRREISVGNLTALRHMKKVCDEKGIKLVLFASPSTRNYDMQLHNALSDAAESLNIPFWDLNLCADSLGIAWQTDIFDAGDHLNLSGAQKVTWYLARELREIEPDLPDHRKDLAYQDWDADAEEYRKEAEEGMKTLRGNAAA